MISNLLSNSFSLSNSLPCQIINKSKGICKSSCPSYVSLCYFLYPLAILLFSLSKVKEIYITYYFQKKTFLRKNISKKWCWAWSHRNPNNTTEYFVTKLKKATYVKSISQLFLVKIVKRLWILDLSILHQICDCYKLFINPFKEKNYRGCVGCGRTLLRMFSTLFSSVKCAFLPVISF